MAKRISILISVMILILNMMALPVKAESVSCFFTYIGSHYHDDPLNELYESQGKKQASVQAWRGETVFLKAAVSSEKKETVKAEISDLRGRNGILADVSVSFLEETEASLGTGLYSGAPSVSVPDIVGRETEKTIPAGTAVYLWITLKIPVSAQPGDYEAAVTVSAGGENQELSVLVHVVELELPEQSLSMNLWQYPYAALRYYDCLEGEEPFSGKHKEVLSSQLRQYHSLGGESITVTVVDEPWGHQTYDPCPAMIRWHKDNDGWQWFDYSAFDAWVTLCMENGIDERIDTFSILPWDSAVTFDLEDGSTVRYPLSVGSDEWQDVWTNFLINYIAHLEEKGWFEKTYIFIDERDDWSVSAALDLIASVTNSEGKTLKTAAAVNTTPTEETPAFRADCLSVSLFAVPEESDRFQELLEERKLSGKTTTLYTCSTNYPNSFAISRPDESLWTMLYLYRQGFDGFLRWALDAWNESPRDNLFYDYFEAGDIFLLYPDEKDAVHPLACPSVRFLMLDEGRKMAEKADYLLEHLPECAERENLRLAIQEIPRFYGTYNAWGAVTSPGQEAERELCRSVLNIEETIEKASEKLAENPPVKPWHKNACP